MPHRTGEVLDNKYEIVERLGAGGMGEVYKAVHTFLGATRVIKVVHPQISTNEDARNRFLREARAATRVQHPNVATLHDFSALPDGSHYMVWEYIDGENLAQRLRARGTLPPDKAVRIAIQALHGLEAIHRAGIIHRDISPENLMITNDSVVKIIDLGVAKIDDPDTVAQTRTGIFVGKLRYASPEQLGFLPEGEKIDVRTDLYSVGMVLYELLTGRPPYEAKSPHEYFLLHAREEKKKSVELPADLPGGPALRAVLARALSRDRRDRFASAAEFAAALEHLRGDAAPTVVTPIERSPSSSSPLRIGWIALVAAIAIAAVGAVMFWPQAPSEPEPVATAAPVSQAAVDVVTTSSEPVSSPVTTTTAAPPPVKKPVVATTTRPPEPVSEPEPDPVPAAPEPVPAAPEPTATGSGPVYVDGGGDDATNDAALETLRREAAGVRRVEIHAGAMQAELIRAMKEYFPNLEIAGSAPVVIHFDGVLERLGRGRKRRAATATITKNGRVVFRYRLPEEVFRVGMHPPQAFARVLSDAIE